MRLKLGVGWTYSAYLQQLWGVLAWGCTVTPLRRPEAFWRWQLCKGPWLTVVVIAWHAAAALLLQQCGACMFLGCVVALRACVLIDCDPALLLLFVACCILQLEGMLSPFGELKDCVVIVEKMTQKSKVSTAQHSTRCRACMVLAGAIWCFYGISRWDLMLLWYHPVRDSISRLARAAHATLFICCSSAHMASKCAQCEPAAA